MQRSFGSTPLGTSSTAAPASTSIFGQAKPAGSLFGGTQPSTSTFTGFGTTQPQQQTDGAAAPGQQPPSTSMFGQPPASGATLEQKPTLFGQPASSTGTSWFGNATQSNLTGQPATGPASSTQQPAQGTQLQQQAGGMSLFAQPAPGTTTMQPTSLFGQPATSTTATQPTSLFGQPPTSTMTQPTSMFGQPAAGTAQQPAKSFFGQPSSTTGTSLFGSTTQPATGFASSTQQPAQQGTNLFGNMFQSQPPAPATAGSNLFGAQQSISPIQAAGPILFAKTTKFNDLPDEVKKKFEALDTHIQGRIQISSELKRRKLGQEPTKGRELIREMHKELLSVTSMVQADVQFVRDLKAKTEQAVQDTITATRIIDGFKNPQQSSVYLKNHASFPLEFFTRVTKEMQERMQWCKNTTEQIERKLSSAVVQQQNSPQAIASTLQAQHGVFVSLAAKTAAVNAELQKLKALYTQLWRAKTGSVRDPFNDLDRGSGSDFGVDGVESLRVKSL